MKDDKYYTFIPTVSLGVFKIGDKLSNYFNYKYTVDHIPDNFMGEGHGFDVYFFPRFGIELISYDGDTINSIGTENKCLLNGENTIGMPFKVFKEKYGEPDDSDTIYLPRDDRKKHGVYGYNRFTILLWTFRNRIVTVDAWNDDLSNIPD